MKSKTIPNGAEVRITQGPEAGVTGFVFWQGQSKVDPSRQRYGLTSESGQAHWADEDALEMVAGPPRLETLERGRKAWVRDHEGRRVLGEIFWVGMSRRRPPTPRYGLRTRDGDVHWVDAPDVEPVAIEAA